MQACTHVNMHACELLAASAKHWISTHASGVMQYRYMYRYCVIPRRAFSLESNIIGVGIGIGTGTSTGTGIGIGIGIGTRVGIGIGIGISIGIGM